MFFLTTLISFGQECLIPNEYTIIIEKSGDLDNDGVDEKVIVYDTNRVTDSGNEREIVILKNKKGEWVEWQKSKNAILKSKEGGPMGEPFEGIEIQDGILSISFYGGSNWKWAYTDKYKFQNNQFELIAYSSSYFMICNSSHSVDFNVSTGKLTSTKKYEECKNDDQKITKTEAESFYKKGVVLTLQNRKEKETKIVTPKYGRIIYL